MRNKEADCYAENKINFSRNGENTKLKNHEHEWKKAYRIKDNRKILVCNICDEVKGGGS